MVYEAGATFRGLLSRNSFSALTLPASGHPFLRTRRVPTRSEGAFQASAELPRPTPVIAAQAFAENGVILKKMLAEISRNSMVATKQASTTCCAMDFKLTH